MLKLIKDYFSKTTEQTLIKLISEKFPEDKCRPGLLLSYLGNNRYYGAIHIFGDSVINRYIIFNYSGSYNKVLNRLKSFIEKYKNNY